MPSKDTEQGEDHGITDNIWKNAKGVRIKVKDMGTSHLVNTVKFLQKKSFEYEIQKPLVFHAMVIELEKRNIILELDKDGALMPSWCGVDFEDECRPY